MKKRPVLLFIIFIFLLTSCATKSKTLETYLTKDSSVMDTISQEAEKSGMDVSIKGNTITYICDTSDIEEMTEDFAKSDDLKEALDAELSVRTDTFKKMCKDIENETNIKNIKITIKYVYKNYTITEQSFTSGE
jgi:hypothetical protein